MRRLPEVLMGGLVVLIVVAAVYTVLAPRNGQVIGNAGVGDVSRYTDDEAGVVCWVFDGYKAGGIDCLPLTETELTQ